MPMLPANTAAAGFSIGQARSIVKDLFRPNPAIYWGDFLASFVVGTFGYALVRRVAPGSPQQALAFGISVVLYYRSALFIHEMAHFRDSQFKNFRIAWNLLCGIPFLTPSFTYYSHVDHHMRKHYGTNDDGEYLPLGTTGPRQILLYLCQPLLIPVLAVLRFLVLAPLGWICPPLRHWLQRHASTIVMDPTYVRPLPGRQSLRIFRIQESGCFLVCLGAAVLLVRGRLPIGFLYQGYATAVVILYLNHLRTLGSHRYTNATGEMTFTEQLLDSVNFPDSQLSGLIWAPLGLRYHALHHLFPSLPYHNLAAAHRRLMAELPADSAYRRTNCPSLPAALGALWQASRRAVPGRTVQPAPRAARGLSAASVGLGQRDCQPS